MCGHPAIARRDFVVPSVGLPDKQSVTLGWCECGIARQTICHFGMVRVRVRITARQKAEKHRRRIWIICMQASSPQLTRIFLLCKGALRGLRISLQKVVHFG
jgi:hypothetical protein